MSKILIVIPTLNASSTINTLINKLQFQTYILIIDSSSSDQTQDILRDKNIDFLQIERKEFNHASTRNLALNYDADFYLFMTQDALPYDQYLVENLLKPFSDPEIAISYARQISYDNADEIEQFARETNYPENSTVKSMSTLKDLGIKTFFSSNSCAMYRASYFKKVQGFKEGLIMNEDMEFAARAIMDGKKVAYRSDAKVYHSHSYTLKDIFKRYFDIGVFFKTNSWIIGEVNKYTKTESTGVKQAIDELRHLWKVNKCIIPKSILFSFTKYLAFKLGFRYKKLPMSLRKQFSLHKNWHH